MSVVGAATVIWYHRVGKPRKSPANPPPSVVVDGVASTGAVPGDSVPSGGAATVTEVV